MKEVEIEDVALKNEIAEHDAFEEKKRKSMYQAFSKVTMTVGTSVKNEDGIAVGNTKEYSDVMEDAPQNYPQAFDYDGYLDTFSLPMGATVKISPGSNEKQLKKWVKNAKKFNDNVEKYLDQKAANDELSEEYTEAFKAITTDRIKRTIEGYTDDYISSKTPLGMVNASIDACSTSAINKASSDNMAKWNKKFPLWSYYKNGEKQLRTLTEYWKDKNKSKGMLSDEKEDKYRRQLYEATVKMINYQQRMMDCVTNQEINQQLVEDKVFDTMNNPYHIHKYSARGITATSKTHETYKACLENGWAIDDIPLVAAFSTFIAYTESCVMSKRSALKLNQAEFYNEPKFGNDPDGKKLEQYNKALALYEEIKNKKLKSKEDRLECINKLSDFVKETRDNKLYFTNDFNNTSLVFNYFDQVKKEVDYRTKLIDAGLEKPVFNTDFTVKTTRDTELTNAFNSFNAPRMINSESDEHKVLREAVEDLQVLLEEKLGLEKSEKLMKNVKIKEAKERAKLDPKNFKELTEKEIGRISIFNSQDAAYEYAEKYLSKLDEVAYKSRLYQKEKDGTSSTVGLERLKGSRDIEIFVKKERNRLLKDFIKKGYVSEKGDLTTLRVSLCSVKMQKAIKTILKYKEMPKSEDAKKELNSLVADVFVSKLAGTPANHPLVDVMGSEMLKKEILKSDEFKKMMKDYYKDASMTPNKLASDISKNNKMLELKTLNKAASDEKKHREDKVKDSFNTLMKSAPKPKAKK